MWWAELMSAETREAGAVVSVPAIAGVIESERREGGLSDEEEDEEIKVKERGTRPREMDGRDDSGRCDGGLDRVDELNEYVEEEIKGERGGWEEEVSEGDDPAARSSGATCPGEKKMELVLRSLERRSADSTVLYWAK
jgi:hypothetical protein